MKMVPRNNCRFTADMPIKVANNKRNWNKIIEGA